MSHRVTGGRYQVWSPVVDCELHHGPRGGRRVRLRLGCGHVEERKLRRHERIPAQASCEACKDELIAHQLREAELELTDGR